MIGEPLVTDRRLEEAEAVIRREFPGLPESAEFVTYRQERGAIEAEERADGLIQPDRAIPEVAVCGILLNHPVRSDLKEFKAAGMWLHEWQQRERDRERLVGTPDPLLMGLRAAAQEAMTWYRAAEGLIR